MRDKKTRMSRAAENRLCCRRLSVLMIIEFDWVAVIVDLGYVLAGGLKIKSACKRRFRDDCGSC